MTQIQVALLGLGNVGRSFVRYLIESGNLLADKIKISAICDSTGGLMVNSAEQLSSIVEQKQAGRSLHSVAPRQALLHHETFLGSISDKGVKVLVESLPTNIDDGQPALGLLESALRSGLHVATVDKGPLVHGFARLKEAAEANLTRIGFNGTTGVAIPDELLATRIVEIRGVLNGTSNYILSEMQEKDIPFSEALSCAQENGIAEPDPRLDIDGWDTACKILILGKSLMGAEARLSEVSRTGIGPGIETLIDNARKTGRTVRLVGRARIWQGRVRISVAPKLLTPDSSLFSVAGTSKAAMFALEDGSSKLIRARSGRDAIAQTLVEDVIKVASEA